MQPLFQFFVLFVYFIFSGILHTEEKKTLAVLDFENNSIFNAESYSSLSQGLADMMISELNQVKSIQVVERRQFRTLLDEVKISQAGVTSGESTLQVGRMLGAQNLVFGSFLVTLDNKIRIDLRIVEVETGLTLQSGEVTGKTRQVLTLIKELSKKILADLDIQLSKIEKSILEKDQKLDMMAVVSFSQGVAFEDSQEWAKAVESYRKSLEIEPDFEWAKLRLQKLKEGKNTSSP